MTSQEGYLRAGSFDKRRLAELYRQYAYLTGEFQLSSGMTSNYYINSKTVTLLPEGAYLIARGILDKIEGEKVDAIGGAALGAAPISGALAVLCFLEKEFNNMVLFVDRKKAKKYGDQKRLEGPDINPGSRVVIVDDVATTGGSSLEVARELKNNGCEIVKVVSLLDRKMGAGEMFEKEGIPFEALLTVEDLDN